MHIALNFLCPEQIKDVATKEMLLVGVSSGSRSAAGGLNFMKSAAGPAGDKKEAET